MLAQGEAARRGFAAYLLRMVSAWVLYKDSKKPQQRRIAWQARVWIYKKKSTSPMSFHSVCEILDLPPEEFRAKIGKLRRSDFLRKAQECYSEEQKPEGEPDEPDDG